MVCLGGSSFVGCCNMRLAVLVGCGVLFGGLWGLGVFASPWTFGGFCLCVACLGCGVSWLVYFLWGWYNILFC